MIKFRVGGNQVSGGDYLFGCYFVLVKITLVEIALVKDYLFGGHFAVENRNTIVIERS